ncbi:Putative amidohydrolase [Mycobacteroides abscessus]|nr:Putative amidohydrolase [Mycobacteroides abscessus]
MSITLPHNWADDLGDLADFYRDLHQNPELSFQEHRTAGKIEEAIAPLGLEVTAGIGGTGVVAVLRNGSGPVIWLRADFDALPVQEQTGLPYASTVRATNPDGKDVPVMHACGHDMHVAALVGALRLLDQLKATWSGTVVAVFQPAEEVGGGANAMIADGSWTGFPSRTSFSDSMSVPCRPG